MGVRKHLAEAFVREAMTADHLEQRWRWPMTVATLLLVIHDLVISGPVSTVLDWVIWLVFAGELLSIAFLASDGGNWLKKNPLAIAVAVLTPPLVPAALQTAPSLSLAPAWSSFSSARRPSRTPSANTSASSSPGKTDS